MYNKHKLIEACNLNGWMDGYFLRRLYGKNSSFDIVIFKCNNIKLTEAGGIDTI